MICDMFGNCIKPISAISFDSANNEPLINRHDEFLSYDHIVKQFCEQRCQQGEILKSPDMILFKEDGSIVFVEFKNGQISSKEKNNIKLKAIDGCIIMMHNIVTEHFKEVQDVPFIDIITLDKHFILVYNDEKKYRGHIQGISTKFFLNIYKDKFFKDIKAYSPENFIKWLRKENLIND